MRKIKAYVGYSEWQKKHFYRYFDIVDKIPTIGDIIEDEEVVDVSEVSLDCEQDNEDVYKYNFYKIITQVDEWGDGEIEKNEYYLCTESVEEVFWENGFLMLYKFPKIGDELDSISEVGGYGKVASFTELNINDIPYEISYAIENEACFEAGRYLGCGKREFQFFKILESCNEEELFFFLEK